MQDRAKPTSEPSQSLLVPWTNPGALREKQQKFGILDSPKLLAIDLANPCGVLGQAVLYLDLDDFKIINTQLTEVIVDRLILPPVHELLAKCVEGIGYAYAEGGDEFTILLPNASERMALEFAEAIRKQIVALRFAGLNDDIGLTVSIGVAYGSPEQDGQVLRERASFAKKRAKEDGKNRICPWVAALGTQIAASPAGYRGHRTRNRVPRTQFVILTLLLMIVAGVLWIVARLSREQAPTVASVSTAPYAAVSEKSIAVLPFIDMSEKKDQEYVADGLTEEMINLLGQIPDLRVPARTSSFYFKGKSEDIATIARKLRVTHVLEGSVRKAGKRFRITAQLIRADNGYHVWSNAYDRDDQDLFAVQDDISKAVVSALQLKLEAGAPEKGPRGTTNIEAHNQYLLGRQLNRRGGAEGFRQSAEAYRKAIALDPNYAAPYAGLALAEALLADATGDASGLERAGQEVDKAIALEPSDAIGYAARSYIRTTWLWDWIGAQADIEKALVLDPRNSDVQHRYARLLETLGRLPQAIAAQEKATELDPLSSNAWENLGHYYTEIGNYAQADTVLGRAIEIEPTAVFTLHNLGTLRLLEGRAQEALEAFRNVKHVGLRLTGIAMAEHTLGHAKESQQALEESVAKHALETAYQIAEVFAWRGEEDQAFEWLDRAYKQQDGGLPDIKVDPLLKSLRADPRYKALLGKLKLPE